MNQKQLAILADQTLLDVINKITDDQWDKVAGTLIDLGGRTRVKQLL
jgi:hypothetical protein